MAFFTLLERKILGLSQFRKGPNKLTFLGITQPFADAIKLFSKEFIYPFLANTVLFIISPAFAMSLALLLWLLVPSPTFSLKSFTSIIIFLAIFRINIYPLLISGWSSNRKYATIGALRGVAQTISYEISMALIAITPLTLMFSLEILRWNSLILNSSALLLTPLLVIWLICCVAETNRTPFDFSEGESELVSGFNIEYGAVGFAIIFIAEYAIIIIFAYMSRIMLLTHQITLGQILIILALIFFWVWNRATFPRHRYDLLINLAWKRLLPVRLGALLWAPRWALVFN